MKKIVSILLVIVTAFSFTACKKKKQTSEVADSLDKKTVYTSFYAMYDFTKTIAEGTIIEVINLVPSGVEPHDWEPTASDIKDLSKADGIIYNGNGMEGWIDKIKEAANGVKTLEASDYIMTINDEGATDPHVWLSPQNAKMQMNAITEFLCEIEEKYTEKFKANLSAVSEKIDELDNDFKIMVKDSTKRDIIVTHGAYAYLCNVYGIKQTAIEGIVGESDPSPEKLASVVRFANSNDIKYVFYTNGESDKTAKAIAEEIGGQAAVLNSFEFDADSRDYVTVMRENLESLRLALQ